VLFELLGPIIEAVGFVLFVGGVALGLIVWSEAGVFMLLALSLGMLMSICAIMLEEFSFPVYRKPRQLALLYAAALLESFGYRQLTVWWRLKGFFRWITGRRHKWETITRSASVGAS
jgi:hypothetical protein